MYMWLFIVYTFNLAHLIINVTHTQTHTHLSTNLRLLHRNLPFSTLYIFFHVPFLGTFQTHF